MFCAGVLSVFRVRCVDSVMVCMRFRIAMISGNCCFIVVIGFAGIGELCLSSAPVRVIELFIICMAILSVIFWLFVFVNCVKGRRRRGWFTRARSRVLVSEMAC